MTAQIEIPAEVAEHLRRIEAAVNRHAEKLGVDHHYASMDAEDVANSDGSIREWSVLVDHGNVERLMDDLRSIAQFAGWLAEFAEGGPEDEISIGKGCMPIGARIWGGA